MRQLARASVMALPSQIGAGGDQDGVPVVLAEAVAAGVPVVASRLGGLAEQLDDGKTAWLADPGSAASLADALRRTLEDPQHASAIARAARDIVLPRLSVEHTAEAYLEHLSRKANK
jgi:glycosyltransferase involved in cell wall biosynthesis